MGNYIVKVLLFTSIMTECVKCKPVLTNVHLKPNALQPNLLASVLFLNLIYFLLG